MSRKGYTPDNAACEGFFGRLKNEIFYNRNWLNVSIDEFIDEVNKYIEWYAHKRRKLSLGGLSPISYRKSIGCKIWGCGCFFGLPHPTNNLKFFL